MTPKARKRWLGTLAPIGAAMLAISATALSSAPRTSERNAPALATTLTESVLYSFSGTDGENPVAGVTQGSDSNFYGTTFGGGALDSGTVFKLTPSGKLTTLHSFCSQASCPDGTGPQAGVIQGSDGNFYGTTSSRRDGVSKAKKTTVINVSKSASAVIGAISPAAPFAIVAGSDKCSGQTLAPKKTCTFELNFQPLAPAAFSDTLTIPFNGSPEPQISLAGTGLSVALKGPKSENLGTAAAGSSGKPRTLSISNPGTVSVIAGNVSISSGFTKTADTCSAQTLAPKGKCKISLEFTPPPAASGRQSGDLSLPYSYGSNSGTYIAVLSGTVK